MIKKLNDEALANGNKPVIVAKNRKDFLTIDEQESAPALNVMGSQAKLVEKENITTSV